MLKQTTITLVISFGLILGFSSITHGQSAELSESNSESETPSYSSQNYNFYVSWGGKRLGVIAEVSKKKHTGNGVLVKEVIKETAADRAGIKAGDLIVDVAGQAVKTRGELLGKIMQLDYGNEFSIQVMRDNKPLQLKATLVENSDNNAYYNYYSEKAAEALNKLESKLKKGIIGSKPLFKPRMGFYPELSHSRLGVATQDLNEQLAQYFGVESGGVLVTTVRKDGPAERAGFKAGDCIVEVNGIAIINRSNLSKELNKIKSGQAEFTVIRDRTRMELLVTL